MSSSVISEKGASISVTSGSLSPFAAASRKTFSSSAVARRTRSRTRPSEERSSKMTTRITLSPTIEMWR